MKKLLQAAVSLLFLFIVSQVNATPLNGHGPIRTVLCGGVDIAVYLNSETNTVLIGKTATNLDAGLRIKELTGFRNPKKIGIHSNSFRLTKSVVKNTGQAWNLFDHGLQQLFGMEGIYGKSLEVTPVTFEHAVGHNGSTDPPFQRLKTDVSALPVPEPATMTLFGIGLVGLARMGRKINRPSCPL